MATPSTNTMTAPSAAALASSLVLVPGTSDSQGPPSAALMVYEHAKSLHLTSYDKPASKFHIPPGEAFDIAAEMWQMANNAAMVAERFAKAARRLSIRDGYAVLCEEYVPPVDIFAGGIGGRPVRPQAMARP